VLSDWQAPYVYINFLFGKCQGFFVEKLLFEQASIAICKVQ
jgi:hypothetical protein